MSQWACATLGGETRSKTSKTRSTSEGEVEGACINYLLLSAQFGLDAAMSPSLHPARVATAALPPLRGARHEHATGTRAGRSATGAPMVRVDPGGGRGG